MDGLTSSELIDDPQLHVSIHTLYGCCLDTLKSISAVALPDESYKAYHARLKIWGAGLFTEEPSLDEILEEEAKRYRPLLNALQSTLFSIAVEEVVFLKSRQALDSNNDTDLQLEPQTTLLLDLIAESHIAISAYERRLPHLVNISKTGKVAPLTLHNVLSQGSTPSSDQIKPRKDRSFTSHGASPGFINRLSKNIPAAKEAVSLFTKTTDRVRAASPSLAEGSLKEDNHASLRTPSEACHEDHDMYLGDFVESLFDLLPSIRGIRRARLLEVEVHQSNERFPLSDVLKQARPQSARKSPESRVRSDGDRTGSRIVKHRGPLRRPFFSPSFPSSTTSSLMLEFTITESHELASQIYDRYFAEALDGDLRYLDFGDAISALGTGLEELDHIIKNVDSQIPDSLWSLGGANTMATIFKTLPEIIGDFSRTLHDCEELLSNKGILQPSAASAQKVVWLGSLQATVSDLKQRVNLHSTKIKLIAEPFELHLLRGIDCWLRQVKKDVAPLKGILIQDVAQSIQRKSPKYRNGRFTVPLDLAKRFEKALAASKPDSVQTQDHLPLREAFDALVFHFANSTVNFYPGSGLNLGQNIPGELQFVSLLKSGWIMERLKGSDYLQSAGSESLWADCIKEIEDKISDEESRFETGELEQPRPDVIALLPDHCFAIWIREKPLPHLAMLTEKRPLEEKILELAVPRLSDSQRCTLTVFRKSPVAFRLVLTTEDVENQHYRKEESTNIDMNSTRFIPTFAKLEHGEPRDYNVLLCNSQGEDPIWHTFQDSSAVAEFQRALTGYRVSYSMSNISWRIEGSRSSRKAMFGKARLQFWHLKPLPKLLPSLDGTTLVGSGSSMGASVRSPSVTLSGSTLTASMGGSREDGMALAPPEPPVLVIFTVCERRYTFFHIKIDESVDCMSQNRRVIVQSSSKNWNFRKLSAQLENEQGLYSWDLACFRYPEHPAFHNLEQVTGVKYLVLSFETMDESREFCKEFNLLGQLRDFDMFNYNHNLKETENEAKKWANISTLLSYPG